MKKYCAIMINEMTGKIDHAALSTVPIPDHALPVPRKKNATPQHIQENTYIVRYFEVDLPDGVKIRARNIIDGLKNVQSKARGSEIISNDINIKPGKEDITRRVKVVCNKGIVNE